VAELTIAEPSAEARSSMISPGTMAKPTAANTKVRDLGDGSFGKGELWWVSSKGCFVAIKSCALHNDAAVKLMVSEGTILQKLCHPNIISLFGFGIWQGHSYAICLQYFPDGDALNFLKEDSWTTTEFVSIVIQLLGVIGYLLSKNIVHGDLKPENLLLSGRSTVTLIDFGGAGHLGTPKEIQTHIYADTSEFIRTRFTDSFSLGKCMVPFSTRKVNFVRPFLSSTQYSC